MKKLAVVLGVSAALSMGAAVAADTETLIVTGTINPYCLLDLNDAFSFDITDDSEQQVAEVGVWCNDGRSSTNIVYDVGGAGANGFRLDSDNSIFIAYNGRVDVPGGGPVAIPPTGGAQNVTQPAGSGLGFGYAYSDVYMAPIVDGSEWAGNYTATVVISVNP